jgi:hypothetical protein
MRGAALGHMLLFLLLVRAVSAIVVLPDAHTN